MSPIDTIVLAGGKTDPQWREASQAESRALVPVEGEPMYRHVLRALQGVPVIRTIFFVGEVPPGEGYQRLEAGRDLMETVARGLEAAQSETVLLCTVDLPFLTSESVAYFLSECEQSGAAVCYAIVPASLCSDRFPQMKRTTVRLREGEFTGGNLFWGKREIILSQLPRLRALYAARKQPFRLAWQVGIGILLRFLLAQYVSPRWLSIAEVERRGSQLIGMPGKAIICPYPEVGTDIDRLEQWRQVEQVQASPQ